MLTDRNGQTQPEGDRDGSRRLFRGYSDQGPEPAPVLHAFRQVGLQAPERNGPPVLQDGADPRVRLDDPSLPEPFTATLFPSEEGDRAQLVWNRRRE